MDLMSYVDEIEVAHGNIEVQIFKLRLFNEWLREHSGGSSDLFSLFLSIDDCLSVIDANLQQIEHSYLNLPKVIH